LTTTTKIESRIPYREVVLAFLLVLLLACGNRSKPTPVTPEDESQVVSVALQDFAGWKEATFGDLSGILVVDANSQAEPKLDLEGMRSLAPNVPSYVDAELVDAFLRRNRTSVPVAALIAGSPWVRVGEASTRQELFPDNLPKGAKALGSLTLPGFSADGLRALLLIHHSWSIHGATVTYVLSRTKGGAWRVIARDQAVFL
jgi:hypothetical protein